LPFNKEIYRNRRLKFARQMREGMAIIPTSPERTRNRDIPFPHRPDSYFSYLTGFKEPEAVLIIVAGKHPKSILFCREKNPREEVWTGRRFGPEGAEKIFGFHKAHPIGSLDQKIPKLIAEQKALYVHLAEDEKWNTHVIGWINEARALDRWTSIPLTICDPHILLDEMRLIKQPEEIKIMRRAAEFSAKAHRRAMRECRPGMMEYELEAELAHEFRRRGGDPLHAYPSIVAGGDNACILHYIENNDRLRDGDLVLIDAGCELDGYASDITRTFPINGRFTEEQGIIYELVLKAQLAAIGKMRPGNRTRDPHKAAARVITAGLVELGILKENPERLLRDVGRVATHPSLHKIAGQKERPEWLMHGKVYIRFFMHGTGHWLGMDVHDAGDQRVGGEWRTLEPGMIMTVEPGIYIPLDSRGIRKKWRGIGARIEDDVLITEDEPEVLTSFVPKTVDEIELLMR